MRAGKIVDNKVIGFTYVIALALLVVSLIPTNLAYLSLTKTKIDYILKVDLRSPTFFWCPGITGDFEGTNDVVFYCEPYQGEQGKTSLIDSVQHWERHVILSPGTWTFTVIFQQDGKVVARDTLTKVVK